MSVGKGIPKPGRCHGRLNGDPTVWLEFDPDQRHEDGVPEDGRYWIRGGIVWPGQVDGAQDLTAVVGYAVLLVRHVRTEVTWVMEERRYQTISHVIRADGGIEAEGLWPVLGDAWRYYLGDVWYAAPSVGLHEPYMLQVMRERCVAHKPQFIEATWTDDHAGLVPLLDLLMSKRLRWRVGGGVDEGLQALTGNNVITAPVRALMTAAWGMSRWPLQEYWVSGDGREGAT